jgi:uncharacterized repeat protein (TIGR01451 family)
VELDTTNRSSPDVLLAFNQNAKLAALTDNGGATLTHALMPGSPAIGSASVATDPSPGANNAPITLDQRRFVIALDDTNVPDSGTDIGAFELNARPQADLKVSITDGKTSALPGQTNTYTITVTNIGPTRARLAQVVDNFPATFTGVSYTATETGGASGFTGRGVGNIKDSVTLPPGSNITYRATGTISASASGTLSDTVTITPNAAIDPNLANNSATDTDSL